MKRFANAFFMGLGMFTSLPCPYRPWDEDARDLMLVCLPLVGAVIGLLWVVLCALIRRLLPFGLWSASVVALPWLLTGFIHLDGFMDTCDALLSWRPLEKRLAILKDSHTGSFAVISLVLLAMFSYEAAGTLDWKNLQALLFVPIISRCGSAYCVLTLRPIGHSEYAKLEGKTAQRVAVVAMWLIALILCRVCHGRRMAAALIVETLAYALSMLWAYRTMKGVSGDLAGFSLTLAECAALVAMAVQHNL